jgi:hypothetical protein
MVKLLLYVHDFEIRKIYLKLAAEINIECEVVHSFEQFYKNRKGQHYSGLLVDIVSSIRASAFDRAKLADLMEVYPSLRLRWDPVEENIRTYMTGAGTGQRITLKQFVETYCQTFKARSLRFNVRKELCCNVLCSSYADVADELVLKSVTIDLSIGGCFLFSTQRHSTGSILWLRFIDLIDNAPIQVEVLWGREWGKTMSLPGVGVRFLTIKPEQLQEIKAMVGNGQSD